MTNVPYGMIMMTTNERLRGVLEDGMYGIHGQHAQQEVGGDKSISLPIIIIIIS